VSGAEAKALGLVEFLAEDPETAALAYFDTHLAQKSAAALALAVIAVRGPVVATAKRRLDELVNLYIDTLMKTRDANEGIAAFIARRQPQWEHR
jgi:cyclohexa-1,5-dienecarbonyl-CoA hydratase